MSTVFVQEGIVIPESELEITTSRSGGPGGQHVQKTSSKVTVRWNVKNSSVLTEAQKERILQRVPTTHDGDLIIHASTSRSQLHNKKEALERLAHTIRKALIIPKKRMRSRITQAMREARLKDKTRRSNVKEMRKKVTFD